MILFLTHAYPEIKKALEVDCEVLGPLNANEIAEIPILLKKRIRIVVTNGRVGISGGNIDELPNLGLICCTGSGFENVDLCAANRRQISVTCTRGENAFAVAELAVGLLINAVRGIHQLDSFVRRGLWTDPELRARPGASLYGHKVGVVGFGSVGSRVGELLRAFGSEVRFTTLRRRDVDGWVANNHELAMWSESVVICCRPANRADIVVDKLFLDALGPDGNLVNVSRGSVIDEAELASRVRSRSIGVVALDVFQSEPFVPDEFVLSPQTIVTPHAGDCTIDARYRMSEMLARQIHQFLSGESIPGRVV